MIDGWILIPRENQELCWKGTSAKGKKNKENIGDKDVQVMVLILDDI